MKILIATIKSWNIQNAYRFKEKYENDIETTVISDKEHLNFDRIREINPEYIFFPHWSWTIPEKIHENYECILFHMTDLPFGRGGSPLQNLIEKEIENTKISAFRVCEKLDAGNIYLKEDLNLNGSAEEIYMRASDIIFKKMIPKIIFEKPVPITQTGEPVEFKRRKAFQSEILPEFKLNKIYDYIRMLDAEGYPRAFIRFGDYKLAFSRASMKNGRIVADVEISMEV